MSLVGPRPIVEEEIANWSLKFLVVLPGYPRPDGFMAGLRAEYGK